jgi:hypothetical protein
MASRSRARSDVSSPAAWEDIAFLELELERPRLTTTHRFRKDRMRAP